MVSAEPIPATDATARRPRSRPWITANRLLALLLLAEIAIIWADVNNWADFGVNRLRTFYILAAIVLLPPAVASIRFAIAVIARRRRFQFGVSSVLLVMTICAAASAWLAWRIKQYRIEEQDLQAIDHAHGIVWLDWRDWRLRAVPKGPKWLCRLLGDGFFGHANRVTFADDASAQLLAHDWASQLESVTLDDLSCPDSDLLVSHGKITDAALNYIDKLPHLTYLRIIGGKITDGGMTKVRPLTHLWHFEFIWAPLSDTAIRNLVGVRELEYVRLSDSGITDAGLGHLRSATKVKYLELEGCKITDAGIAIVERMTKLVRLDLSRTAITDSGLARLKGLTNLNYLIVVDTPVTPFAAEELAAALPHCKIFFGGKNKVGHAGPLQPLPDQ